MPKSKPAKLVLNINVQVRVTLTPFGKQVYNAHYTLLQNRHFKPTPAPDVLERSLYELMHIFGRVLALGTDPVFVNNNIEVLE